MQIYPTPSELLKQFPRFWSKVTFPTDLTQCWLWHACIVRGYGQFTMKDSGIKQIYAHRLSYELLIGSIPNGLTLDHICRNRSCVHPGHLEPVTNATNILRGMGPPAMNARKTHCRNGHLFNTQNTYARPSAMRHRECRTCKLNNQRKRRE